MFRLSMRRLSRATAVRIVADAIIVGMALLVSLTAQFLWMTLVEGRALPQQALLAGLLHVYLSSLWALVLISLGVYAWSGFYTGGRTYRRHYKAKVIMRAVSVSYVLFVLWAFIFPQMPVLPRATLVLAWLLTLVFTGVARLWPMGWKVIKRVEQYLYSHEVVDGKIKNVLVIGGAGYIGSALLPKLLDKGYHVRLLDLLLFGTEPIADVIGHPELEIVQADFRQVEKVVDAMRDIDAVIHLGAIVGDPACALDEELTIEVNLIATRMIAEVAKGSGVHRLIFASTCSVYGASDQLLDEHSALNPVSLYARSKIASEKVLRKMAGHFTPVILRFGTIYGLSGRTRFDLVVNLLAAKAVVDGQIPVFGGEQWRPFVHVDDAALAVLKALEAPRAVVYNQIFNVGSDEQNYTIQQIGEIVHHQVPTSALICKGSDTDQRNYRVSFGKIRNVLGFVPQRSVADGVQEVIEAIQSGKVKDYRDAQYSNVKFLSDESIASRIRCENGWASELLNEAAPSQKNEEEKVPTIEVAPSEVVTTREADTVNRLSQIDFGHLLRREPVVIDPIEVAVFLRGATVLVTGAGGSIGRELCRQVAQFSPKEIILLGHSENSIFEVELDLRLSFPTLTAHPVIADIRDQERINSIVKKYRPDVIFHMAAYTHAHFMEADIDEAMTNNVLGTHNVLQAAEHYGVERFVLTSSDKVADPSNVIGATKRLAELLVAETAHRSQQSYLAVRLGNVLDSRSSLIPVFLRYIAASQPLTIAHPSLRCYFMTISEAVQLILQAVVWGRGGEVFVQDMGSPIRILDVATDLIKLLGLEPGRDVKINFTGMHPVERLSEELFLATEHYQNTKHQRIFVATNGDLAEAETVARLVNLARHKPAQVAIRRTPTSAPQLRSAPLPRKPMLTPETRPAEPDYPWPSPSAA